MRFKIAAAVAVLFLSGCASLMSDQVNAVTSFSPYITPDGKQSFRFVAHKALPSEYHGADVQKVHEEWISRELGQRQYCMHGFDIVSRTEATGDMIVYEGVCRQ